MFKNLFLGLFLLINLNNHCADHTYEHYQKTGKGYIEAKGPDDMHFRHVVVQVGGQEFAVEPKILDRFAALKGLIDRSKDQLMVPASLDVDPTDFRVLTTVLLDKKFIENMAALETGRLLNLAQKLGLHKVDMDNLTALVLAENYAQRARIRAREEQAEIAQALEQIRQLEEQELLEKALDTIWEEERSEALDLQTVD